MSRETFRQIAQGTPGDDITVLGSVTTKAFKLLTNSCFCLNVKALEIHRLLFSFDIKTNYTCGASVENI